MYHRKSQQSVVSISSRASTNNLSETPNSEREIMRIHEPSFSIRIKIHQIQQDVVVSFEMKQDFNHAINILKRIGYRAQNGIPPALHAIDTNDTTAQSDPGPYSYHSGPRLSSFTPLGNGAQQLSQSNFSFTSMLNSDIPLSQLLPLGMKDQCFHHPPPYNVPQQSRRQSDPATVFNPHPSHQNFNINQSKIMYQPLISSPLRHALPVDDQNEAPNSPMPNSQPTFCTDYADMPSLSSYRSISEPNSLFNHSQLSETSVTSYDTSLDPQFGPSSSQESLTSVDSSSQATDTTDDNFQLQLGQDFRKFLPRTRSLPFLKGKDHKVAKSKPRAKQNQRHSNSQEKKIMDKNADVHRKESTKMADSNNDDSQLVLHHTPPRSKVSQASDTPIYHSSLEETKPTTMLIADPILLERANKATSQLFDQYNEDLSRGCNAASYAEFYLEQIQAIRTEFWFNELSQMKYDGLK
ncbi:uncharacterized protein TrAtP1_007711 [Trichoderma atroviride]|uniref:uncharacterized protein n=1 Tax=Hypocrea atroviridis TaxID=63577 RepID=UPI00332F59A6|nr:hypothetical protein TrAtP1_007711 [Trichoderma atroviride]